MGGGYWHQQLGCSSSQEPLIVYIPFASRLPYSPKREGLGVYPAASFHLWSGGDHSPAVNSAALPARCTKGQENLLNNRGQCPGQVWNQGQGTSKVGCTYPGGALTTPAPPVIYHMGTSLHFHVFSLIQALIPFLDMHLSFHMCVTRVIFPKTQGGLCRTPSVHNPLVASPCS